MNKRGSYFIGRPNTRIRKNRKRRLFKKNPFCHYCELRFAHIAEATFDHILPTSKGGTRSIDNLVLACHTCNQGKGNKIIFVGL
jgi:5-methylcytosine-specific restriction endonuclease McrA